MTDNFNHIPYALKELEILNHSTIVAGVPQGNDHLNMIALVQEQGKTIHAKNYPYLVVPTGNAQGRKTSEIVGLYQRGHALGIDDKSQPYGFKVMFVLRKSITIKPRPFLRQTLHHHEKEWTNLLKECTYEIMMGRLTAKETQAKIGNRMVKDIKETLTKMSSPKNAPLTEERKGFNDPLIDKGQLRKSIQWFIKK